MPRSKRLIRKRYTDGVEILDSELEETFLMGRGCIGTAIELRTLDDWKRLWSRWRGVVMPKVLEHWPGIRPLACYVTGEIPPRPVVQPPPMNNHYWRLYVPASNGTGQWHYDYPEPYQQDEAAYLYGLGVIDKAELKRHRAWRRRGRSPYRGPWHLGDYVLEQGLHQ